MTVVRPERPEDYPAARRVQESAFAPSVVEADTVERLRATGALVPDLCLVAVADGDVVGHLVVSRAHLDTGTWCWRWAR